MDVTFDFSEVETKQHVTEDQTGPGNENAIEGENDIPTQNDNGKYLKPGDKFYGTITTNQVGSQRADGKKSNAKITGTFTVKSNDGKTMEVTNNSGTTFKTSTNTVQTAPPKEILDQLRAKQEAKRQIEEQLKKELEDKAEFERTSVSYLQLKPEQKLESLIDAGFNNCWLVGPAGSGKSTMVRNTANKMELPYLCISCGIGTSAAEFVGYKYPTREATKFSDFYTKPSIILIDEITALDPAVAQVLNAALANDEIETTTGLVKRHPECIIVATSNTFGNGASRQYVANNQLDASTIDRFVGATIEIDYSVDFEAQYDKEVVNYVNLLRKCIKQNEVRRVASTRMIQSGTKLKAKKFKDWKDLLTLNWTISEKKMLEMFLKKHEEEKQRLKQSSAGVKAGEGLLSQICSN